MLFPLRVNYFRSVDNSEVGLEITLLGQLAWFWPNEHICDEVALPSKLSNKPYFFLRSWTSASKSIKNVDVFSFSIVVLDAHLIEFFENLRRNGLVYIAPPNVCRRIALFN